MTDPQPWSLTKPTAVIVLADGTVIEGQGCGADGIACAEICFNTAITGYQEILTDPSYAGQIVTFTFPHIGNIGTNEDDMETLDRKTPSSVVGAVFKAAITSPSNYRSATRFDQWLKSRGIIAICNVDTRALTSLIREKGLANAVIASNPDGIFDIGELKKQATEWPGLEGADLAATVTSPAQSQWDETSWVWNEGYSRAEGQTHHVVAVDFGIKRNILRLLADLGCKITIVPASASAEEILGHQPDGIFLSNGPGDPAATGEYAVATISKLLETDIPIFGICLGHQMLALALGAKTVKMHQGHHGANHPVMDHTTGKVEIVSMNHGFAVDGTTLPDGVKETHTSLFDQSNCGLAIDGKAVFSVQHHPEASPGPRDSHYLFKRFIDKMIDKMAVKSPA
ncbi:MAG: glutamine-hydrolyzing carbamoyl-phosphate synthase small subunit [Hyphomicrobiales bacterium]|nr:glutamine-hydrolyzing carbamoyl-phosphate synthase small subunit [Hyphomicrobiales bacterium]